MRRMILIAMLCIAGCGPSLEQLEEHGYLTYHVGNPCRVPWDCDSTARANAWVRGWLKGKKEQERKVLLEDVLKGGHGQP